MSFVVWVSCVFMLIGVTVAFLSVILLLDIFWIISVEDKEWSVQIFSTTMLLLQKCWQKFFQTFSFSYSPAQTIEGSVSPPSNRRFPPMMDALKLTDRFDTQHTPLTNGHTLPRGHRRTRTTSSGSSISDDGALSSPNSPFGRGTFGIRFKSTGSSTSSISSTSGKCKKSLITC